MILSLVLSLAFAEEPVKISEEGVYYYKEIEKSAEKVNSKYGEVIKESTGTYFYKTDKEDSSESRYGEPAKIKGRVSYYDREESPQDKATTVQFVSTKFDEFQVGTTKFEDIYGSANGLLLDFEWHKNFSFIKLGYIVSSGIYLANGNGVFADNQEVAREKYDLIVVPIVGKIRFNFEYSDRQYVVPYADAGAGVYGLMERRDDGEDNNSAYTPVFLVGGGLNFLLDWISPDSIARIDNSFGINHMWLNVGYQLLTATESDFDVGGGQLQVGFKFDY